MKTLKKVIKKILPLSNIESLRIDLNRIRGNLPIIVYTMGKVGSITTYKSLQSQIPNPIYHVHFLSHKEINRIENKYSQANAIPNPNQLNHFTSSKIIRSEILNSKNKEKFKIISLTREPISLKLSHFFQNPKVHRPHLVKYLNKEDIQGLTDYFLSELESSSYTPTWFDKEFKQFLEIDIYQYKFDSEKGYSIYYSDKFDILLMRLEDLSENFQEAIQNFLGINNSIKIIR